MKPHKKKFLTTGVGRAFERLSYFDLLLFSLIVTASSTLYFYKFGKTSIKGCNEIGILEAFYFSIVTFTTLGYGDISPIGTGRLVAGLTAVLGLALTALLIGKLSSERQSSLLTLIYTSDAEKRLAKFCVELEQASGSLSTGDANDVREALKRMKDTLEGAQRYILFNSLQARLSEFGNDSSFVEICKTVKFSAETLIRVSKDRRRVLHEDSRKRAHKLIETCEEFFTAVDSVCKIESPNSYFHHTMTKLLSSVGKIFKDSEANKVITPASRHLEWIRKERLSEFSASGSELTVEKMEKVRKRFNAFTNAPWPKGIHKEIAKDMGISNSEVTKYVDLLKDDGDL